MGEKRALVIAVEHYHNNGFSVVKHAEADARSMESALKLHGFDPEVIVGTDATKNILQYRLGLFFKNALADDELVLYYAGHGFSGNNTSYLSCYDSQSGDSLATSISFSELMDLVYECGSEKVILFLDCCHSGLAMPQNERTIYGHMSYDEMLGFLRTSEHKIAFAACKDNERSRSSDRLGHGIWTYHLVEALTGEAPTALEKGCLLTASSLQNHLKDAVMRTHREDFSGTTSQTPCLFGRLTCDFLIADLGNILAQRAASKSSVVLQLDRVFMSGYTTGTVKSLSGFRKGNTVPSEDNDYTQAFVRQRGQAELEETTNDFHKRIKDAFRYKRVDMKVIPPKDGASSIICPAFDLDMSLALAPEGPHMYAIHYDVNNIREPNVWNTTEFTKVFGTLLESVTFEFNKRVDIPDLVDRLESLDIEVEYPPDCSSCSIELDDLRYDIEVTGNQISIKSRVPAKPNELMGALLEARKQLSGSIGMKALPWGINEDSL